MQERSNAPSKIQQVISQFVHELHPERLLPSLTAGTISGILNIGVEISFAALIFSGALSPFLSRGIGLTLFGAFAMGMVVALTSSVPGMIAAPQDSPAAILALVAAAIAANLPASATPEETFSTVVAAIMLTSLLTGIFFVAIGHFKLGGLVRFIPYPVIGGFLAGTGWLLVMGGMSVITDVSPGLTQLPYLLSGAMLIKWLPGLAFGALLLLSLRRYNHFLIMPAMLLAAIGLFYFLLALSHTTLAEAGAQGWLLGPFPKSGLWQPLGFSAFTQVNWTVIFANIGSIGSIVLVSAIALLLNASGLELAMRRDLDLNRELQAVGLSNIVASLGGGPAGYSSLSLSLLGQKMGANSRLVGIFSAALCGMTLLFGASALSFFPKPVIGGLLFFLGISLLVEWVYDAWFTLPKSDYALALLILAIVGGVGFLEGILTGTVVAVILFVIKYSRINIVKQIVSGMHHRSHVGRIGAYRQILRQQGAQILILKLQGFIFFGTADNLLKQVRDLLADTSLPVIRFIVLDFHLVNGLDSSALHSFIKMKIFAETRGFFMVLADLSPQIHRQFEVSGSVAPDDAVVHTFPDLDHAVEWCEEQILSTEDARLQRAGEATREEYGDAFFETMFEDILKFLDKQELFESIIAEMSAYFKQQDLEQGTYLLRQGAWSDLMYFVKSGQVTVQLEREDGGTTRLGSLGTGSVVGEMGLYLNQPACASALMQESGTVYCLSKDALQQMKADNPQLAALFHEFMARHLSERLDSTTSMFQTVPD